MNSSILAFTAGCIRNKVAAPTDFNGGTPTISPNSLLATGAANAASLGGLSYSAAGALLVDSAGAITTYVDGIPLTAAGAVAVDITGAAVASYQQGLPYTAAGRLALAVPE